MTYQELRDELERMPAVAGPPPPAPRRVVVGGMGGSALPADALRFLDPSYPITSHRDYGLPELVEPDTLFIAMSYSGNTEETLSFAEAVRARGLPLAVVDAGGVLLALARTEGLPHVEVPSGLQPRNALFYQVRALLALLGRTDLLEALARAAFDEAEAQMGAEQLASHIGEGLPLFYAARANGFVAHVGKIIMNETAKMPAFANVFPELNHNEMQSFDRTAPEAAAGLARFVLLTSAADSERVARRMQVFAELMRERGRSLAECALTGENRAVVLARAWYLLHRAALALAAARGIDPEAVPLVEEFKKRIA